MSDKKASVKKCKAQILGWYIMLVELNKQIYYVGKKKIISTYIMSACVPGITIKILTYGNP